MSLPTDISTADALAHLTRPDRDAGALDRRRFLQLIGMGAGAGLLAGPANAFGLGELLGHDPSAWAAGPVGPNDGILVVIGLYGGNDGLSMVAPTGDPHYYTQHGRLAIAAEEALPLRDGLGLHPRLTTLHDWWQRGQLAVVQGVGYPQQDESHFNSMAYWMSGRPHSIPTTGWLGRWLDGYLNGRTDLFAAAAIGSGVPLHLVGAAARATGVPDRKPDWGSATDARAKRGYATARGMRDAAPAGWAKATGQALVDSIDLAGTLAPIIPDRADGDAAIVHQLGVAARLINAGLGFRVLTAGFGDFDSHANQPSMHASRMAELDAAIARFFSILDPAWANRVTVMTFSEFGRTSWANDGQGTDHGSAAPHFVIGPNVRGGLYGTHPKLAGLGRWERMAHTVDFRSYYASVIDGWLGGGSSDVLGGSFENLRLFAHAPGAGPAPSGPTPTPAPPTDPRPPYTGSAAGGFVPIQPTRFVDTRQTGTPIGPGQVLRVPVAGRHQVPVNGLTAVVANVTAVEATQAHFFTVYPGGTGRPFTSNLNGGPGRPVPNLVISGVGADGAIEVYNSHGSAHCIVDVFGYFTTANGAQRFTPVTPTRMFDTRDGTGIRPGPIPHLEAVGVDVAGTAGVHGEAAAVVLNLTATETTAPGFLRLSPSGGKPAETSNVNFFPGDTVPNLVIVRLGDDGRLLVDGAGASKQAIGDVFGYFGASGDRLQAVAPSRLLDTREGLGATKRPLAAGAVLDLQVTGRGGVPESATAVVLNVTATNVAAPSFVTVWPAGQAPNVTSNLNLMPGQTIANLVICGLGAGGRLSLSNQLSACDLIADVTAYFVP